MTRPRVIATVTALVTLVVLGGSGTAVAAWQASASVSATASSATVATTVAQTGLATDYRYAGTNSNVGSGSLTIANTGTAPLSYTLANAVSGDPTFARQTALTLWAATRTTDACATTAPAGAVSTTLANLAPELPAAAKAPLAPGAAVKVCVITQIKGSTNAALQGKELTFTLTATGSVGTWTASAQAPKVTQRVFQIQAPSAPVCAGSSSIGHVIVRWTAPAGASDRMEYRVYEKNTGQSSGKTSTTSIDLRASDFDQSRGRMDLVVEATDLTTGTTSPASAVVSVNRNLILFAWYLACP
jgi:hypothetical protein